MWKRLSSYLNSKPEAASQRLVALSSKSAYQNLDSPQQIGGLRLAKQGFERRSYRRAGDALRSRAAGAVSAYSITSLAQASSDYGIGLWARSDPGHADSGAAYQVQGVALPA